MSDVTKQVADVNREINRRAAQACREFVGSAWALLVNGTPVDTPDYSDNPGVARGNWNFGVGSEDTTFSEARTNAHGPVPDLPNVPIIGETLFLTNHTPYAEVLEYGGYPNPPRKGSWNRRLKQHVIKSVAGFSQQAPAGWVRLAAAQLGPMAEAIITRLRR